MKIAVVEREELKLAGSTLDYLFSIAFGKLANDLFVFAFQKVKDRFGSGLEKAVLLEVLFENGLELVRRGRRQFLELVAPLIHQEHNLVFRQPEKPVHFAGENSLQLAPHSASTVVQLLFLYLHQKLVALRNGSQHYGREVVQPIAQMLSLVLV